SIGDDGVIDIHLRGQLAPPVRHGEAVLTAVKRVADATGEEGALDVVGGHCFPLRASQCGGVSECNILEWKFDPVTVALGVVAAAMVAVEVEPVRGEVLSVATGSSSSVRGRPLHLSSFVSGFLGVDVWGECSLHVRHSHR
ncbi:unnamed protein product, partial [Closterium sp. NIES-53]